MRMTVKVQCGPCLVEEVAARTGMNAGTEAVYERVDCYPDVEVAREHTVLRLQNAGFSGFTHRDVQVITWS